MRTQVIGCLNTTGGAAGVVALRDAVLWTMGHTGIAERGLLRAATPRV